jgi:hypothetical protein
MKMFCHINEFGTVGFSLLPTALLFNRTVSLWSPSPWLIEDARKKGESVLAVHDILRLIEQHEIVVMGRTEFLTDKRSRVGHPWAGAAWYPKFDDILARWAAEDEAKTQKRVVLIPDERGWKWAEKQLDLKSRSARVAQVR